MKDPWTKPMGRMIEGGVGSGGRKMGTTILEKQ